MQVQKSEAELVYKASCRTVCLLDSVCLCQKIHHICEANFHQENALKYAILEWKWQSKLKDTYVKQENCILWASLLK